MATRIPLRPETEVLLIDLLISDRASQETHYIFAIRTVRISQETRYISTTKIYRLLLFRIETVESVG
jgi:hypothetical protein